MSNQSTETEKIKAKDDQTAALIAAQVFIVFSAILVHATAIGA